MKAREILWRRTMDDASFEHCRIEPTAAGVRLTGTVLAAEEGRPLRVDYALLCEADWRTRRVEIAQTFGGEHAALLLEHDGAGNWRVNGEDAPRLSGCMDVDLDITPATNALPINRLKLAVGASADIRAAWVHFPKLDVEAAGQSYARLADRRYRYKTLSDGFEATVEVDVDGLTITYGDLWRRVAE